MSPRIFDREISDREWAAIPASEREPVFRIPTQYRVVNTDNYNGDYPDERFESGPLPKEQAQTLADSLNEQAGPYASRYFKVEPEGYDLQPGFEP